MPLKQENFWEKLKEIFLLSNIKYNFIKHQVYMKAIIIYIQVVKVNKKNGIKHFETFFFYL